MAISHKLWVFDLSVWWTWLTDWVLGFSWRRGWCGDGCESTNSPGLWEAAKNSSILASLTLVSDSTCERELPKSGLIYIWFGLQTVEAGAEWKSQNVPSNFEGSILEMVSYLKFRAPSVSFPYFSKQLDKRSLQPAIRNNCSFTRIGCTLAAMAAPLLATLLSLINTSKFLQKSHQWILQNNAMRTCLLYPIILPFGAALI